MDNCATSISIIYDVLCVVQALKLLTRDRFNVNSIYIF